MAPVDDRDRSSYIGIQIEPLSTSLRNQFWSFSLVPQEARPLPDDPDRRPSIVLAQTLISLQSRSYSRSSAE